MTTVLVFHSHGGGTGKTTFAANIAALLAQEGRRVCLMDTDVQSPGLHVLLGLDDEEIPLALSDYLVGGCDVGQMIYDLSDRVGVGTKGLLTLVPSRIDEMVIEQLLGRGYDAGLLDELIQILSVELAPDVLIIDTHSGMTNETMVSIGAADALIVMVRADAQDYRGAGVTTAMARRLNCPRTSIVLNMVGEEQDVAAALASTEAAFGCPVSVVVSYSADLAALSGASVVVLDRPGTPLVDDLTRLTGHLAPLLDAASAP